MCNSPLSLNRVGARLPVVRDEWVNDLREDLESETEEGFESSSICRKRSFHK
jgi:hypothetical protein